MFGPVQLLMVGAVNFDREKIGNPTVKDNERHFFCDVLPDGNGGYEPCPELLTESEAINFLRLEKEPNPKATLEYYRSKNRGPNRLRPTRIGKKNFYWRQELVRFIEVQTMGAK